MSQIKDDGASEPALKEDLLRLTKAGKLQRYSYGMYYLDGGIVPNPVQAIELRYLKNGNDVFGFYTGPSFVAWALGHEPNASDKIEIMSNRATSGKKSVYMFSKRFVLRKPYVPVTADNVALNAFLSYIAMASLDEINKNYSFLATYIRQKHLSANDVMTEAAVFPAKTSSKLIATDLYRSLWRH